MTLIQSKRNFAISPTASLTGYHASSVDPRRVLEAGFENLDITLDSERRTLWYYMRPANGLACFTVELLQDISAMHAAIRNLYAMNRQVGDKTLQYVVGASHIPGIYNMGGDLALFANKIRNGQRSVLEAYAHACIDLIYTNSIAYGLPLVTIGLVQGDALGGGFECALSYDVIIAERSAKLGLPEILFNLFPGMGAYSFLSRRLDPARAEKMILSGRIYTAEELFEMGVVDVLAENGEGHYAAQTYIDRNARKHNAYSAVYAARRRVNPIPEQELRDVVDIWVDAALNLQASDLRKMERLAAAQAKRVLAVTGPASQVAAE